MDLEHYLDALNSVNNDLCNLEVNRAYSSVGSNIFFKFGPQIEESLPSGKKILASAWTIWIGNASWRITKCGNHLVGSADNRELICKTIERFVGKRFCSVNITSNYLDAEFLFENDYKLNTFFHWSVDNQWAIFLPNRNEITIDCSTKDLIHSIIHLSKQVNVNNHYDCLVDFVVSGSVIDVIANEAQGLKLLFLNDFFIDVGSAAWRFTKQGQYYAGEIDYYFKCKEGQGEAYKNKLSALIGRKINKIKISMDGMDIKVQFSSGYNLEIFTHSIADPWTIKNRQDILYSAQT